MYKQIFTLLLSLFVCFSCSNKKQEQNNESMEEKNEKIDSALFLLIGTYTDSKSKGIYVYRFDTITGKSEYVSEVEIDNPSYLAISQNQKFVYAVSENYDIRDAFISAFSFDKEKGNLHFINRQPTGGASPCYVCIDKSGKHIVTANYSGASITEFLTNDDGSLNPATQLIGFEGGGTDPDRQKQPHLHCVMLSPDQEYLFANDLGTDKIHKFDTDSEGNAYLKVGEPPFYKLPDGAGPRHMEFHPNGQYLYVITELSGEVIAFDYADGKLTQIQQIQADTLSVKGSGDIHLSPDGKFLYASNRLKGDGLAIFSVNEQDGKLTKVGYQQTGSHPRNFVITPNGEFILVANRDSNNVQVFRRDKTTGLLTNTETDIKLNKPVCLKFASSK